MRLETCDLTLHTQPLAAVLNPLLLSSLTSAAELQPARLSRACQAMEGCDFGNRSESEAWGLCWIAGITFVVSLYLVPARLRRLPRSDPDQVSVGGGAPSTHGRTALSTICVCYDPAGRWFVSLPHVDVLAVYLLHT